MIHRDNRDGFFCKNPSFEIILIISIRGKFSRAIINHYLIMGITVEFNPDLALRDFSHFRSDKRKKAECLPAKLEKGKIYQFLKSGQRNYWLFGEIPLLKTEGNQKLSRPVASIKIIESTHFISGNQSFTKGKYKIIEVYDPVSKEIHFESYAKINKSNEKN